jgi:hypothetical protein
MKALSIRQPWASLIVAGYKDIENRSWRTSYRGPVLIHSAQRVADVTLEEIARRLKVAIGPLPNKLARVRSASCCATPASCPSARCPGG